MTELEAKFRIVTPLFMSGADRNKAELRVPSIKGVLRFWWRALMLGRLGSIEKVRREEAGIFGSAGEEGQSRVHLRLSLFDNKKISGKDDVLKYADSGEVIGPGARYLGYGLMNAGGKLTRPSSKCHFGLELLFKPDTKEEHVKPVEAALIAMGLFGGLGSRSRRGYGSLNLLELKNGGANVFEQPKDRDDLRSKIQNLFKDCDIKPCSELPPYTAYSTDTRIDILDVGEDPLKLLNSVGEAMQMYRSYGRNGKVNGRDAERYFDDDHDLVREAITDRVKTHPRRVVFGLPHNYHFSDGRGKNVKVKPEKYERRASPLFLHIQGLENGQYAAITTTMPAEFLPYGEKIKVGGSFVPVDVKDFQDLHEFLDGVDRRGEPRFPYAENVIETATSTKVGAAR
ncbi:MAG: type III-B CRISPR module RAMP protein Cmr1 [Methanotrichaceae archaeon]